MSISIYSKYTNYTYTLQVYVPRVEVPMKCFGVIYVLDGQNYFDFAKQTVDLQYKNAPKTNVHPAIIVSINHQKEDFRARRFQDFTAKANSYVFPPRMQRRDPKTVGGANEFHEFITKEVKAYISANYSINPNKETIYGHSLGGYYTLWTLFNHPETFANYISISPSIWWNDYEMWAMADEFIKKNVCDKSLFISTGELEGFMAEDALTMYKKLSNTKLRLSCYIAPEENHASVVPTTISRAFRFLSN